MEEASLVGTAVKVTVFLQPNGRSTAVMFIAQKSQYHPASVDKDPETCWMSRLSVI